MNRRRFLAASSGAVVAGALRGAPMAALARIQAPAATDFKDRRRGVGLFTGRGGTIGFLAARGGVVVVDSQFPETARASATA